jgi:hypothetical protein
VTDQLFTNTFSSNLGYVQFSQHKNLILSSVPSPRATPNQGSTVFDISYLWRHKETMSLYHETAEFLTSSAASGGSLKSRIFSKKDLKSQPAQVYALAIESSKWSSILKEVIEASDLLRLERKVLVSTHVINCLLNSE